MFLHRAMEDARCEVRGRKAVDSPLQKGAIDALTKLYVEICGYNDTKPVMQWMELMSTGVHCM